jgi:hypothetical protein
MHTSSASVEPTVSNARTSAEADVGSDDRTTGNTASCRGRAEAEHLVAVTPRWVADRLVHHHRLLPLISIKPRLLRYGIDFQRVGGPTNEHLRWPQMRDQLRVGWPHLFKQSTRKGQVGGGATSDADGDGAHRSGASSSAGGGAAAEAENHGICHHARATAVPSPSTWPPSRTTWFNPTSAGQVGRDTQVGCSRVREPTRGEHDSRTRSDETSGSPASHTIWSSQVTAMASNQIIQDGTTA